MDDPGIALARPATLTQEPHKVRHEHIGHMALQPTPRTSQIGEESWEVVRPRGSLEDLYCSHAYYLGLPNGRHQTPPTRRRETQKEAISLGERICVNDLTSLFFIPRAGWYPNLGETVNRRTRNMGDLCQGKGEADRWGAVRSV